MTCRYEPSVTPQLGIQKTQQNYAYLDKSNGIIQDMEFLIQCFFGVVVYFNKIIDSSNRCLYFLGSGKCERGKHYNVNVAKV